VSKFQDILHRPNRAIAAVGSDILDVEKDIAREVENVAVFASKKESKGIYFDIEVRKSVIWELLLISDN
jgi:hypothetical protein